MSPIRFLPPLVCLWMVAVFLPSELCRKDGAMEVQCRVFSILSKKKKAKWRPCFWGQVMLQCLKTGQFFSCINAFQVSLPQALQIHIKHCSMVGKSCPHLYHSVTETQGSDHPASGTQDSPAFSHEPASLLH